MPNRRKVYLELLIVATLAWMLYLPLRSIQWDLNGITEARAIDSGGTKLFSPNHMLYRPLGLAIITIAHSVGFSGHSAEILQYVTGIMAGVGVGLVWRWIMNLTDNTFTASIASAFLATTWAFWTFSTDVYYITPAAAMVAGALVVLSSRSHLTHKEIIKLGLLVALAILFWQANIFLIPTIVLGLLWMRRADTLRETLIGVGLFLAVTSAIVGSVYLIAGTQIYHLSSTHDFFNWFLSHGSGGNSPFWGKWSADRIPAAMSSALASFIPVLEGLGLRDALGGNFSRDKFLAQLSLVALVFLCVVTCIGAFRKRRAIEPVASNLVWLGLAYIAYIPFIIWWDPYEPKWFVVPNLFLVAILAQVWNILFNNRRRYVIVGGVIVIIAAANFGYTVWPRHSRPNPNIQMAQCFAAHSTEKDVIMVTDWGWFGYAVYFFDYRGNRLPLGGDAADKPRKVQLIKDSIAEANREGGHVYMRDLATFSPGELAFVESLTGFVPADFSAFKQHQAFSCNGSKFVTIVQAE
jgi:hypothetical protein